MFGLVAWDLLESGNFIHLKYSRGVMLNTLMIGSPEKSVIIVTRATS